MANLTPEQVKWAAELYRCQRDFPYAASTYFHIKSKHTIGLPTLKPNKVQRFLYAKTMEQLKRTGRVRQIWGKSRQVGASTLSRAFSMWNTAFKPNRNSLLVTHDEPTSFELFTVDQLMYENLPGALKPKLKYDSKSKMEFARLNSKVTVGHARNMNVGASGMQHFVHMTEVARYPNADEIQASLFPSISDAAGDDYSVVIMESTSHFNGAWFKEFAEAARRGENGYEFHFVPWYEHEDYQVAVPHQFSPTADEKDLMRRYKLTLNQIAWRRSKRAEYVNPAVFEQEFPLDWESSWRLPQGTMRTFSDEDLAWVAACLRPGKRAQLTTEGATYAIGGPLEVWAEPVDGVYYHLGVDVAIGRDAQADYTVCTVVRGDTFEQVAEARFHWDPADVDFHNFVHKLAQWYNMATIIPDITGGWGHALLSELQRRAYPNLWQWKRRDDVKEKITTRVGFLYTKRDKIALVNNGVTLIKQQRAPVHSLTLYNEMLTYLQVGLDQWGGAPGTYDDAVNAWLLAVLSAADASSGVLQLPAYAPPMRAPSTPWSTHDIDEDMAASTPRRGSLQLAPFRV